MNREDMYDCIGIGIGPYNLSLAALMEEKTDLKVRFFDQTPEFQWHPGMLINLTDLQVPFIADLVTFANPQSRYSYLNYLHTHNRLYKFFFFQKFEMPRQEYNDYARWVVGQLPSCQFQSEVTAVTDEGDFYKVEVNNRLTGEGEVYHARNVVMGTGSKPLILDGMDGLPDEDIYHTSQYLFRKEGTMEGSSITIVGSGQSAAEVFYDLLKEQRHHSYELTWLTRSEGILQLESSKLGQEFFAPDYVDYFHGLTYEKRMEALETLDQLRNGIDPDTLNQIYNILYNHSVSDRSPRITIQPLTEVNEIRKEGDGYMLSCRQWQEDRTFSYGSDKVILATGYKPNIPQWFFDAFNDKIVWEDDKKYKVSRDYRLQFKENPDRDHRFYTVTNLEHSHGAGATNLGLAVDRNIQIINDMAGKEVYKVQRNTIFSQFTMDNKGF
ncbi:lysine N(6)-hydroxylase/L-ornithine N(5)-oxygenase family protein [Bacillus sp. KH172YL63]|uniref:lysine N(6)-hydroxylase/L-ornithine N(5)-oxygenase family protein n=1 Tax=Bacillus sp. KH172YL63 TaxID=2709784 RepID=UPI0013E52033|nr:SidA/IucD/PvdA family monooxygenase [Bacillus sp. KH172YL63]BCB02457.1 lysine 6-monooxygenase [Bacillus sp. KH172YL63]